ncbi:MAG: dTMP kinase [Dehalococcoidia bacterium]|nr:dTMP kinase [Dehalococcoidia bacterium]MDZ4277950.1 dTMP kinase [Dehalococcoidia bacterium]
MGASGDDEQRPRSERSRGLLITLEGGEGAGKSVQLEALARRLEQCGHRVVRTREPGGTPLGERVRTIVLDLSSALDPLTETLLFVAARAELVAAVIDPALARGDIVVCDRFGDSTLAYQGFGRGVEPDTIERLNSVATRGLRPDVTVLLDLPTSEGLTRNVSGDPDRFEREAQEFHERVRRGYHELAAREPARWLVVDAGQPREAVTDAIWRRLEPLLDR